MEYICDNCKGTFIADWSDEEASIEFSEAFPHEDIRGSAIVCDDCYINIMRTTMIPKYKGDLT